MINKILSLFIFTNLFFTCSLLAREYTIKDYLNPNNQDRKEYIERYKDIAMQEMSRAGIPASIKLAQGILESGDGKSKLAFEANNHFGMKCGAAWEGETFYLNDDDYDSNGNLVKSCFRVFDNAEDSYLAHSEFLHNPKKAFRYGFLFDLDVRDYRAWAKGLKKAGYATNPRYPQLLIGIIEANKLYEYDLMNLFELDLVAVTNANSGQESNTVSNNTPVTALNVSNNEVVLNNGLRMIFAQEGDTPKSIEQLFGVKAKKVTIHNELYEGSSLKFKDGDRVYLQCKRKKWRGKVDHHKVKTSETMYDISQIYGIRLASLYKKNRMIPGTQPAIGQKISIRKKINKRRSIKLRDIRKDPVRPKDVTEPITSVQPTYELNDGENVVDIIRTKVNAFDMEKRKDAYLKITDGNIISAPSNTNINPPVSSQPSAPDVVTPSFPTTNRPTVPTTPTVTTPYPSIPTAPSPSSNSFYHTVESGDTLYAIARKYNVDVAEIKRLNGFSSNVISIGQKIRVR